VAAVVGALQATAAMKLLLADEAGPLISLDAWRGRFRTVDVSQERQADCPCCAKRLFEFLERRPAGGTTSLCGRDAVQVTPPVAVKLDLKAIASTWRAAAGDVELTPFLLRCRLSEPPGLHLTLFADGRLIVKGTADVQKARSAYARFVGI
jgi:adenylyltransferase/sulfurtransferase